jgi:hypothetical protein
MTPPTKPTAGLLQFHVTFGKAEWLGRESGHNIGPVPDSHLTLKGITMSTAPL